MMVISLSFLKTWHFKNKVNKNKVDKLQSNRQKNRILINLSNWWLKLLVGFKY